MSNADNYNLKYIYIRNTQGAITGPYPLVVAAKDVYFTETSDIPSEPDSFIDTPISEVLNYLLLHDENFQKQIEALQLEDINFKIWVENIRDTNNTDHQIIVANMATINENIDTLETESTALNQQIIAINNDLISNYLTATDISAIYITKTDVADTYATKQYVDDSVGSFSQEALDAKVDKEEGKGLSTNDFTDDHKAKLEGLNIDDSDGLSVDLSGYLTKDEATKTYATKDELTAMKEEILNSFINAAEVAM